MPANVSKFIKVSGPRHGVKKVMPSPIPNVDFDPMAPPSSMSCEQLVAATSYFLSMNEGDMPEVPEAECKTTPSTRHNQRYGQPNRFLKVSKVGVRR
jgi:hypothetical protein